MKKWKHHAIATMSKGKLRINCVCGKQSPLFSGEEKEEQAEAWFVAHTKLVEQRRPRQEEK